MVNIGKGRCFVGRIASIKTPQFHPGACDNVQDTLAHSVGDLYCHIEYLDVPAAVLSAQPSTWRPSFVRSIMSLRKIALERVVANGHARPQSEHVAGPLRAIVLDHYLSSKTSHRLVVGGLQNAKAYDLEFVDKKVEVGTKQLILGQARIDYRLENGDYNGHYEEPIKGSITGREITFELYFQ
jgi:hypothetical protein